MKNAPLAKIRAILILPALAGLFIILLIIALSVDLHRDQISSALAELEDARLSENLNWAISSEVQRIEGLLFIIERSSEIKKALENENRQLLWSLASDVYAELQDVHNVTRFLFVNPDGRVLLRMHEPARFGDRLVRETYLDATTSLSTSGGLEIGYFGQPLLRVVKPWIVDEQTIGYLAVAKNLDSLIDRLALNNDYEIMVAANKNVVREQGFLEHEFTKPISEEKILVYKTPSFPTELTFQSLKHTGQYPRIYRNNAQSYFVSAVPLSDAGKNELGQLIYMSNQSASLSVHDSFAKYFTLIVVTLGLVLGVFYFLYSRLIKKSITDSYFRLREEVSRRRAREKELEESKLCLEKLVTERDESLNESKRRYKTLFEKTADALLLIEGNRFVDCNQAALDMLGYVSKRELYQAHPSKLSPEFQSDGTSSLEKADLMIETALKNGSHRFEWEHVKKNGDVLPVEALFTAIPYGDTQLLHVVWRDISDRRRAEKEIEYHALYDSLTMLPNKRLLFDRIHQSMVTAQRYEYYNALLFIDLDRFKSINDTLGHNIGDALLVVVAGRLRDGLRKEDTAARFGGDEFVVLLRHSGTDRESVSLHAEKVATKLHRALSEPVLIKEHELHITASIGVAVFPNPGDTVNDVLKNADTAMFSAKESGRNRTAFYFADMHKAVLHRLTLERELRKAVGEKSLSVYYQPQISLKGELISVEALLRWSHPKLGMVSPEEFIPIAEETGLIDDLGEFVLSQSLYDICQINGKLNRDIKLSINISQKQFDSDYFIQKVQRSINAFDVAKDFLTLEITEGLAISNLQRTIKLLHELREMGVRVSLDDFGTGYSSLSHIKRLPLDELKIDKSFVMDIIDDPQDALLVKTIVGIAKQFGLMAVAEGVETKLQLEFFKGEGCDVFQGYYYAKPLAKPELIRYIQTFRMTHPRRAERIAPQSAELPAPLRVER